jgi:hypothetical protein
MVRSDVAIAPRVALMLLGLVRRIDSPGVQGRCGRARYSQTPPGHREALEGTSLTVPPLPHARAYPREPSIAALSRAIDVRQSTNVPKTSKNNALIASVMAANVA